MSSFFAKQLDFKIAVYNIFGNSPFGNLKFCTFSQTFWMDKFGNFLVIFKDFVSFKNQADSDFFTMYIYTKF